MYPAVNPKPDEYSRAKSESEIMLRSSVHGGEGKRKGDAEINCGFRNPPLRTKNENGLGVDVDVDYGVGVPNSNTNAAAGAGAGVATMI